MNAKHIALFITAVTLVVALRQQSTLHELSAHAAVLASSAAAQSPADEPSAPSEPERVNPFPPGDADAPVRPEAEWKVIFMRLYTVTERLRFEHSDETISRLPASFFTDLASLSRAEVVRLCRDLGFAQVAMHGEPLIIDNTPGPTMSIRGTLFGILEEMNPGGLLEYCVAEHSSETPSELGRYALEWAGRDPAGYEKWVEGVMKVGEKRADFRTILALERASRGLEPFAPEMFLTSPNAEYALGYRGNENEPFTETQDRLEPGHLAQWLGERAKTFDARLKLLDMSARLPTELSDKWRGNFTRSIINTFAMDTRFPTLAHLVEQLPPQQSRAARIAVVQAASDASIRERFEWLNVSQTKPDRAELWGIVESFQRNNPREADEWAASLPADETSDQIREWITELRPVRVGR
jgi:hypothetical protein